LPIAALLHYANCTNPASAQPIEVVLADFQMPDMDGAMLGARIKADPAFSKLRLVLLTSLDRQGDPQHFTDMGFAAYLTKPVRARELRDCLQQVLMPDSLAASGQHPVLLTQRAARTGCCRTLHRQGIGGGRQRRQSEGSSRFLERMGLEVVVANDGTNAVQLYECDSYAIVFMDLQMPLMDGYEATRRIRDAEAWRARTPIVALTANAMSGQLERCLAAGMDALLTKPIQIEQLRDTVATYCQKIHAAAETHALDGATTAALLESPAQVHEVHLDIEQRYVAPPTAMPVSCANWRSCTCTVAGRR
jgi:CheY-like chemotaxis protein